MDQVSESLAGRIGLMHLETFSAAELRRSPLGLGRAFLWQGGYPELWRHPDLDFGDFFESYLRTYLERDLRHIIEVRNLYDFQRFVRLLALRTGQLINYTDIAKDTGVSDATARNWLHGLELSGLVYLLPPYHANIGKRLIKTPKLYFADHGLLCYLLNIRNEKEWYAHPNRGHIWENISFLELIKNGNLRPGEKVFFYRDQNGVEIDFIIEQGQKLYLIEAKAAERVPADKLNFAKVAPLLASKGKTVALLLQNTGQAIITKKNEYYAFNPLLVDFDFNGSSFDEG
jgi:predicted AAA+ superfamily ATPase